MKRLAVLMLVAAAGTAHADKAADVTALVKKNVEAMAAADDSAYTKTLAKDAVTYDGNGVAFTAKDCKDCSSEAFKSLYGEYANGKATHKMGKLVVQVDEAHGVAWFQGPFDATFKSEGGANPCGPPTAGGTSTEQMRVSGVAIDDKGTWKIAAVMYTHPMSDADLIDKAKSYEVKAPGGTTKVTGAKEVATAVQAWFPKLTSGKSTGKTLVASGSAPGEYFGDAATVNKVAGAWDKLDLAAWNIDARSFGNGAVAFVHADTTMPIKKTSFAAPFALAAIVVKEGDSWKWVSLQFAPALAPW